jgi:circadian clock protein KaiB
MVVIRPGGYDNYKANHGTQKNYEESRVAVATLRRRARSIATLANLKRICDTHMPGRYDIEVIDLIENPKLAANDQILAVPTLVRKLPEPLKKIIGDLSNEDRVLVGLDVKPLN